MPAWLAGRASVLVLGAALTAAAQTPQGVDASRIHDLIVLVASADDQAALDAADELVRMGPGVAPSLVQAMKTDQRCQTQWLASSALGRLGVEAPLVERTSLRVARGTCLAPTLAQLAFRARAAIAVIDRVSGIELMAELLRGQDLTAQNRAATAIRDLATRLDPTHPRHITATPEVLRATEATLPLLRDVATSRANVSIRCAAKDALDQARGVPHDVVRARATALLATVRIDCSVTDTMRRQGIEEVISRLDTQPPELAARTTSALLAAPGDDVVPLLQKRLRETSTCRGLALVAGILAGRNVVEAEVEAALARGAGGRCDGREPFDLTLAQSAANAFLARPDGVTRLTGWLGDRDVAVRRRAAHALATLFERLGMGEASRPGAEAALLTAARASLPALVTLAQTERDMAARCEAVRAVQRAQEARDDTLRAEADAQSQGRTLRCQAPPPR
jgi:hypothetical protein